MSAADSAKTRICGFDADTIVVRDRDLVSDLMGRVSFTEMFFLQALGTEPSDGQQMLLNAAMVTIMEHGMVPSAIVARLTHYGAPESYQGAIAAGLLGVGDRYAGTASACGVLLERIARAANPEIEAETVVREHRELRKPLPGFGHPIHRDGDPRVARLIEITESANTDGRYLHAMYALEAALEKVLGKKLVTNISAALAATMAEAGIPATMMRGVVLTARCAGLVGHIEEEQAAPVADALWDGAKGAVTYGD